MISLYTANCGCRLSHHNGPSKLWTNGGPATMLVHQKHMRTVSGKYIGLANETSKLQAHTQPLPVEFKDNRDHTAQRLIMCRLCTVRGRNHLVHENGQDITTASYLCAHRRRGDQPLTSSHFKLRDIDFQVGTTILNHIAT